MEGGILILFLLPLESLKGESSRWLVMKRNKGRLWSEPFGAGYDVRGGGVCEVVFSERGKMV